MECPVCSTKTEVSESRIAPTHIGNRLKRLIGESSDKYTFQYRRHGCPECGHKFRTFEFDQEVLEMLIDRFSVLTEEAEALKALRELALAKVI